MKKTNVKIDLRIMGNEFNICEITRKLEIIPTIVWNKGESIKNSEKKRTYTTWIYSFEELETLDINSQIKKLEDLFIPKIDILYNLKTKLNLEISIDIVVIVINQEVPAMYLESKIIQFASKIDAKIDIDTYVN